MGPVAPLRIVLHAVLVAGGLVLQCCGGEADSGSEECRYEDGNTYMQEYNKCRMMWDQGVPCTVPPPPVC